MPRTPFQVRAHLRCSSSFPTLRGSEWRRGAVVTLEFLGPEVSDATARIVMKRWRPEAQAIKFVPAYRAYWSQLIATVGAGQALRDLEDWRVHRDLHLEGLSHDYFRAIRATWIHCPLLPADPGNLDDFMPLDRPPDLWVFRDVLRSLGIAMSGAPLPDDESDLEARQQAGFERFDSPEVRVDLRHSDESIRVGIALYRQVYGHASPTTHAWSRLKWEKFQYGFAALRRLERVLNVELADGDPNEARKAAKMTWPALAAAIDWPRGDTMPRKKLREHMYLARDFIREAVARSPSSLEQRLNPIRGWEPL